MGDTRRTNVLHTACGTPAYVAPEVLTRKGYDGAKTDIWSCGVILFVLLAGFLPFEDRNIIVMYKKTARGDFKCPPWFRHDVKNLISRILNPNPVARIAIPSILSNPWVHQGFTRPGVGPTAMFEEQPVPETEIKNAFQGNQELKCTSMNAFDIISRAPGLDLSGMFVGVRGQKRPQEARFTTKKSATEIVSKLEEISGKESRFKVRKTDGVVKLQGYKEGRKGQVAINAEIFRVSSTFHMVEMKKAAGDTLECQEFYDQELKPKLKDIVWTWQHGGDDQEQQSLPSSSSSKLPPLPPRPRK